MVKWCSYRWVKTWCDENGWTDLFIERYNYWAFPPGSVMPVPVPSTVLRNLRNQYGATDWERFWSSAAIFTAIAALGCTYYWGSPMPLVAAFAFCAIAVAQLEIEEI
jgi:hypothetical protein